MKKVNILRHKTSKQPRGFGFVEFIDKEAVLKSVEEKCHEIEGRKFDVRPAFSSKHAKVKERANKLKKIFVGGLSIDCLEPQLAEYFSQFGEIETCYVVRDKITNHTRRFAFIFFTEVETVTK